MKPIKMMMLFVLMPLVLLAADMQPLDQTTWSILAGAFLSGVLLTFTPCVLPMIPIISSIIAGQGEGITKTRAVILSLSYVLGTAVTYAAMGALAGATGEQLQAYFQNVWVIGAMSLIFVAMALSMFGLYTIQLPSFIQSRINASSQGIPGGNVAMVFVLGAISALILGACVSPILISFLSVAIATSDPLLGGLTMFFLALGMGVPLVIVGLGAGHLLPKAGGWMDLVKYFFGTVLLGVAIWIFSTLGLVPELLLWGIYLVIIAVYLNATQTLPETANGWYKLAKGIGTVLLVWGIMMLVGAVYNESDPFHPLPKPSAVVTTSGTDTVEKEGIPFELVGSLEELEARRKQAIKEKKLMIVFFYTDWCPVCKKLKATTLIDPKVRQMLKKHFIALKVNMTDLNDHKSQAIRKKFKIYGPPSFVFFDRNGKELKEENFYGFQEPEAFYDILDLMAEDE
jgi:thiol:disulfide interchange protein DsbD